MSSKQGDPLLHLAQYHLRGGPSEEWIRTGYYSKDDGPSL